MPDLGARPRVRDIRTLLFGGGSRGGVADRFGNAINAMDALGGDGNGDGDCSEVGKRSVNRLPLPGAWREHRWMPVDPHLLAVFTVTTIVALVTPGPDMLFVLGCGMRGGPRAGLLATAGVITGDALYIVAAAAGLAVLLTTFPVVFTVLRFDWFA